MCIYVFNLNPGNGPTWYIFNVSEMLRSGSVFQQWPHALPARPLCTAPRAQPGRACRLGGAQAGGHTGWGACRCPVWKLPPWGCWSRARLWLRHRRAVCEARGRGPPRPAGRLGAVGARCPRRLQPCGWGPPSACRPVAPVFLVFHSPAPHPSTGTPTKYGTPVPRLLRTRRPLRRNPSPRSQPRLLAGLRRGGPSRVLRQGPSQVTTGVLAPLLPSQCWR